MGLFGGSSSKKTTDASTRVTTTNRISGVTGTDAANIIGALAAASIQQQRANAEVFAAASGTSNTGPLVYLIGGFAVLAFLSRRL
jgi:hypothetical protein